MVFRSKWQAFKLATLSGFAEPLGVIIVGRPTSFLCVCETFVLLENKIGKTNLLCFMFEGAGWILTISGAEKAWFLVDSSGFNQNRVAPRTLNFWLIFFFFFFITIFSNSVSISKQLESWNSWRSSWIRFVLYIDSSELFTSAEKILVTKHFGFLQTFLEQVQLVEWWLF